MRGRDLISIADLRPEELELVLVTALALKAESARGTGVPGLASTEGFGALRQAQGERMEGAASRAPTPGAPPAEEAEPGDPMDTRSRRFFEPAEEDEEEGEGIEVLRQAQDERIGAQGEPVLGPFDAAQDRQAEGERIEGEGAQPSAPTWDASTLLAGKTLALLFEKPSLRTRVSFDVAIRELGGHCIYLSPPEVGLGSREPISDVARVLSRYVDGIAARTFEHETVEELARHATVPVINALSAAEHPCQALADLLTVREKKGALRGLTLAYVGDGDNVAASLALGCAMAGMRFRIASPEGYELPASVVAQARELARANGGSIELLRKPHEATAEADVVYTDVWASMGQEAERAERREAFAGYTVDGEVMSKAKRDAIFMHDLPAHRGEEVTAEVIDGAQSVVFDQAENRLHAQKAVLALVMGEEE